MIPKKEKKALYADYEMILVGRKRNFSSTLFPRDNPGLCRENAVEVVRYAIEGMLGWGPYDIVNGLTAGILRKMKLQTVMKHLDLPEDYDFYLYSRYIAHLLYPDVIPYDDVDLSIEVYERVLKGEIKSFPKKFFYEEKGIVRARACLNYALRNKLEFNSVEEIYEFMLTREGMAKMRELGLSNALAVYETPIDLLHESLPATQRDEFLRYYCKFRYIFDRTRPVQNRFIDEFERFREDYHKKREP